MKGYEGVFACFRPRHAGICPRYSLESFAVQAVLRHLERVGVEDDVLPVVDTALYLTGETWVRGVSAPDACAVKVVRDGHGAIVIEPREGDPTQDGYTLYERLAPGDGTVVLAEEAEAEITSTWCIMYAPTGRMMYRFSLAHPEDGHEREVMYQAYDTLRHFRAEGEYPVCVFRELPSRGKRDHYRFTLHPTLQWADHPNIPEMIV